VCRGKISCRDLETSQSFKGSPHEEGGTFAHSTSVFKKFQVDAILLISEPGKVRVVLAYHAADRRDSVFHKLINLVVRQCAAVTLQQRLCVLLPNLVAFLLLFV